MRYNRAPSAWLYLILLCLIKESRVNLSAQFTHIQLPLQLSVRCIEQLEFFTGVVAFHFDNDYRRTFGKRDYPYIPQSHGSHNAFHKCFRNGSGNFLQRLHIILHHYPLGIFIEPHICFPAVNNEFCYVTSCHLFPLGICNIRVHLFESSLYAVGTPLATVETEINSSMPATKQNLNLFILKLSMKYKI